MRRFSGALAFVAGAALIIGSTGAAVGQEDPPSDGVEAAEEAALEMAQPSTLEIIDVAGHKTANKPLRGKKLRQAIAKSAPVVARYYVDGMGADDIERIVEMSREARSLDEAGDAKTAKAMIDLATLLYRNAWSKSKTDPLALNEQLEAFIAAGDYSDQDPALALWTLGDQGLLGLVDVCIWQWEPWWSFHDPATPSLCNDEKGRQLRVDYEDMLAACPEMDASPECILQFLETSPDVGGLGIHRIAQGKTANDKLVGRKFKKAWSKALQKQGPAIATAYTAGIDASSEQQVVEFVLGAREADEAGNAKAARAFMSLALATYRSAVPKPAEGIINTEALNGELAQLIAAEYADMPGLQMVTPEGFVSVCYDPKKKVCYQSAGDHTPWECAQGNIEFTRMPYEDALAANCPEVE